MTIAAKTLLASAVSALLCGCAPAFTGRCSRPCISGVYPHLVMYNDEGECGTGAVWLDEDVKQGDVSDPFLYAGYETMDFSFTKKDGTPVAYELVREGDWVRVKCLEDAASATARFVYGPAKCASSALDGKFPVISVRDDNGRVWKFPNVNGDTNVVCRKVATERGLLYAGGVFYELPAENAGGFAALRPIALADAPVKTLTCGKEIMYLNGKAMVIDDLRKNGTAPAAWWLWRRFQDSGGTSDLVVYGGTSAAISAAVQAKRMGLSVTVVSPDERIGGLTTGGLGQTDIGAKKAFGGIALEFYRDVHRWYSDPARWVRQKSSEYRPEGQCAGTKGAASMWTFEPSAALAILEGWIERDGITLVRGARLDRSGGGVAKKDGKIVSIRTENGREFRGRMFIDATYEGDLMAAAGVSYTVGRESNSVYGETLNGCQPEQGWHKFVAGVDPYVRKGDPSSGLLPGIDPEPLNPVGTGDRRVQAYCFRMCLTDDPDNRIPFKKPASYEERDYELLLRNYEAGKKGLPWINARMPNRKTDTNNRTGFSTDFIGRNHAYPEASYAEREKIVRAHLEYQKGLMWTLAYHPRMPEEVRGEVSRWGTCKDEFLDGYGDGWQRQLYVREARRMVGDYVMTEANCRGRRIAPRPIGMAAYDMDSHHVRRYVGEDGFVQNEGDVEVGCSGPYPIDYGSLVPKRGECENLLVPVCVSASHIAYGSIRMEPVFFALGQSAATAAAIALSDSVPVQDVSYGKLSQRLLADGQVLSTSKAP